MIQGPPPPPGQLKFTVADTCDRIKEEFNFLQAQYHRQVSIFSGLKIKFPFVHLINFLPPVFSKEFNQLSAPSFSNDGVSLLFLFSLKLECEKLATEKTEMQRHYVMVILIYYTYILIIIKLYNLFLTVLWNVLRPQRRDAQTGK